MGRGCGGGSSFSSWWAARFPHHVCGLVSSQQAAQAAWGSPPECREIQERDALLGCGAVRALYLFVLSLGPSGRLCPPRWEQEQSASCCLS